MPGCSEAGRARTRCLPAAPREGDSGKCPAAFACGRPPPVPCSMRGPAPAGAHCPRGILVSSSCAPHLCARAWSLPAAPPPPELAFTSAMPPPPNSRHRAMPPPSDSRSHRQCRRSGLQAHRQTAVPRDHAASAAFDFVAPLAFAVVFSRPSASPPSTENLTAPAFGSCREEVSGSRDDMAKSATLLSAQPRAMPPSQLS